MTTHNVAQRTSAGKPERLWCQVVKPDATGVAMHPALDLGDAVLVSMHPVDELAHDSFQTAFAVGQWWLQAWADKPGAMVAWQNNEWAVSALKNNRQDLGITFFAPTEAIAEVLAAFPLKDHERALRMLSAHVHPLVFDMTASIRAAEYWLAVHPHRHAVPVSRQCLKVDTIIAGSALRHTMDALCTYDDGQFALCNVHASDMGLKAIPPEELLANTNIDMFDG